MTTLDIDRPAPPQRPQRIHWGAIAAVLTVIGWLLMAASGVFGDYRRIGDRVTVLETQRQGDGDRMRRSEERMQRIEDKIDRLLERRP